MYTQNERKRLLQKSFSCTFLKYIKQTDIAKSRKICEKFKDILDECKLRNNSNFLVVNSNLDRCYRFFKNVTF